jgi:4-hydroxy-tetrahydrodipicolinate synthase
MTPFHGVFTALVTPFAPDGSIDWPAFDRLVDRQIEAGIAGLVPVGTTGEAATLDETEAEALIARCVSRAAGRAYVLAGAGANDTRKAVRASKRAQAAGADGILVVTPYYNKPTQAGLIAHFAAVAQAVTCDVMLYSVPGRTGVAIAPETAARLAADHANIVAIKEAGGDAARVTALRAACGAQFVIHSGDDGLALPFYALGAAGLTSVVSNFAPEACVALHRAWMAGDTARALALHDGLADVTAALFVETSPGPVKRALALANLMGDTMRLPLVGISAASDQALRQAIDAFRSHPA